MLCFAVVSSAESVAWKCHFSFEVGPILYTLLCPKYLDEPLALFQLRGLICLYVQWGNNRLDIDSFWPVAPTYQLVYLSLS